ncbi:MAG: phenylacetate-CoA oxygenase subunit PaaJ [Bacteroidia bacterium]|nr:phenylacetate-CoA oxygenase subunit PaaJ [Bacteroidia bacterium]
MNYTENEVKLWLNEVKDPEIPTISIVDLGMLEQITISPDSVIVEIIPTFSGCPALRYIQDEVFSCLTNHGIKEPIVLMNRTKSWSTDRITAQGRSQLLAFGISPPPETHSSLLESDLQNAICPKCHSLDTQLIVPFGPTLCRAIHRCNNCLETFEQFKPL